MTTPQIKTFAEAELRLAESLPGYESRPQQQRLAEAIESTIATTGQLIAEAGCGCIQGDAEIIVNRGGNGIRRTLRQVVEKFNGGGGRYTWDLSIPTYVQREAEDGTVRLARLINAWCSGEKTTYTVTTDTGRTIRATDEHPFLTERGWLRLDELVVGDEVHVRGDQRSGRSRSLKPQYVRVFSMQAHPYANRFKNGSAMVPEHRLVAEAARNGLDVVAFVDRVQSGNVEGLEFLDPAVWAVHHLNENPTNNELGNLKVMTHTEHHALHADQGATNHVLYKVITERVVSVISFGVEMTYDLEVADDPHNFIANGFVVHNTGKSLATMIPAILSGKRTVVSTATKALQDQVANKDLPFLAEHLGVEFSYALLKGRSNYLCQAAAFDPKAAETVPNLSGVLARLEDPEFLGEREDLGVDVDDRAWRDLTISSEECPGRKACAFGETCYAEKAKERAQLASVVVVNHALLCIDSQIGAGAMLGEYQVAIIDEAHELEQYARNAWTGRFTLRSIQDLASNVRTWLDNNGQESIDSLLGAVARTSAALWATFEEGRLRQGDVLAHEDEWVEAIQAVQAVLTAFAVHDRHAIDKAQGNRWAKIDRRLKNLHQKLVDIVLATDAALVRWVETETTRRGEQVLTLKSAPLEVGAILDNALWSKLETTVAVSATLKVDNAFDYPAARLGLTDWTGLDVGTPFNFAEQAVLFVPENLPAPDAKGRAAWETLSVNVIRELVAASGGGALILCTSVRQMKAVAEALRLTTSYRVLLQGESGWTNKALAAAFKEDPDSVLVGTRSFFTGVDFQGDTCRLVVVDKLPFASPTDPIASAQTDLIESRGGNAFADFSIPEMVLPLVQGFGRLIRTRSDRGVVAILDSRLTNKGYGKRIVRSLPPAPLVKSLDDVRAFYAKAS